MVNKKKGELDKELEKKSRLAILGGLFMNPGSISYLLSKRKLRNTRKKRSGPKYAEYKRIEKIR